jgi:ATP-dependent exoDNAse (exonuclease V) beta subunit
LKYPNLFDANDFSDSATIICRNNAPLIRAAFQLLAAGHCVCVAGTDIGPKLIKTMTKLGSVDMTQAQTLSAIDDWLDAKLAKESKTAADYAECMKVFARHGSTLSTAIAYAEHLFKQDGTIRLLTGHKSKGLEFDHVYHLDQTLLKDRGQDRNIHYVIDTRSRDRLTYISTDSINWA